MDAVKEKLTEEEQMLVELRDGIYGGSWKAMVADLKDRLEQRPYVYKLFQRIRTDLDRIKSLRRRKV